jgi:hypothetical protein
MKATMAVIILLLAANATSAETRVSVGVYVGGGGYGYYPPTPPPAYAYQPPCPSPGYVWVPGYWYGVRPRHSWRNGYWTPPRHRGWHNAAGYREYDSRSARSRGPVKYRGYDNSYRRQGDRRDGHRPGPRGRRGR